MRRGCPGVMVWLAIVWLATPAVAASFDCAKATAPDETAVCGQPRLSALDSLMDRAYVEAKAHAEPDEQAKVKADARAFMGRRHACGADLGCLTAAYAGVIEEFGVYGATTAPPPSISALDMTAAVPPETKTLPAREGECVTTRIEQIGGRLEGDTRFETGAEVDFANGGHQVSYEKEPAIIASKKNDRVLMCLTSIPKHCPRGDDRGRMYTTTNLRTKGTWSLPDAQHMCGGA